MKRFDVCIIGAGLAGLSCAYRLTQKGKKVLLLEAKEVVGGRTASWVEDGMQVESGLHRMLGFYEALPRLMEDCNISLDNAIIWEDEIEIRLPQDLSGTFAVSLHKPLKTILTSAGNTDLISQTEKATLIKFFIEGLADLKKEKTKMDDITVREYAVRKKVPERVIHRLLVPLTEGLFFIPPEKYSAYNFFALFAPYLNKLHKTRVGAFSAGMTECMTDPIAQAIRENGGEVIVNAPVDEIIVENDTVKGLVSKKKNYDASAIVIATGLKDAEALLKKSLSQNTIVTSLAKLNTMPSVTAQFELSEPAMPKDRVTFSPGTLFSSYSEQSRTTFRNTSGRLSVILAQSEKYLHVTPEKIVEVLLEDAKKLDIHLEKETIINYKIISWEDDFYSYAPGNIQHIPKQETMINGLFLAGTYTDQEYLQTMEGAVVSGERAADLIRDYVT